MNTLHRAGLAAGIGAAVAACPPGALACSACGCTLGTEWAGQGYSTAAGLRLDLRYDYVDQNQLRLGSHVVDKTRYLPDDPAQEIQQGTLTRFYTVGADYSINRDWGINLQLPYLDREHETIDTAGDPVSTSHLYAIGDLRLLARYQGIFEDRTLGVQFGLKLPTGPARSDFTSGPEAGLQVDRGLQPGSGTTDLLLGVYHYAAISRDWDRFEQLQFKQALDSSGGFRPSTQLTANLGVRYVASLVLMPQLQLNLRWEGHEIGPNGDYFNSGDRAVFVSPGATLRLLRTLHAYGFVQVPAYQYYKGLELAPRFSVSAGLSYAF
ncbi:MAG: hypothetical protein P4L83_17785 [Nevskia sp.]|nr:hypothetical protein [Nevskia sp.]